MLVTLLGMLGWVSLAPHYRNSRVLRQFQWPQLAVIRRLLSVGLPIGISVFAESSIFAVIALLIGAMGATMVAGHQIALNFSSMVFMIPYSLGMAVTVRVGHALGAGSPRGARFAAAVGMATALIYACLSSSAMLLLREQIAQIYTDNPAVIAIAGSLLIYAAIFQFSDAIQVTAAGALRGYQDTRIAMLFTLFAYWGIGLPVGYSLGLSEQFGVMSGPVGLWQGLVVGLTSAAFMLGIRLVLSARRRIRLSEQLSGAPLL
jgi:MATE family multidrug resistance protein